MSGVATAALIAGGIGAAGSIGGAAIEGSAASKAAKTQADAANRAAELQGNLGQESLQNENYQYQQARADEMPWLQGGANSLSSLEYLLGLSNSVNGQGGGQPGQTLSIPGVNGSVSLPGVQGLTASPNTNLGAFGSLMSKYPGGDFTAPTADQARATPGYQFALDQGTRAVNAGAAANGSLLTGGTQTALQQYGQGLADTNYNNVYNRALQSYNTNYNTWSNNQANQFNRLSALAGMGQTSAQHLGAEGLQSAGQVAQTLTNTGQEMGQQYNNAAAATASGYIGQGNAWGGALGGLGQNAGQLGLLMQLLKQNGGGGGGWSGQNAGGQAWNPGGVTNEGYDPNSGALILGGTGG